MSICFMTGNELKIYNKKDGLKVVKKRLKNNNINYDEIACVLASIKSKNKKVS